MRLRSLARRNAGSIHAGSMAFGTASLILHAGMGVDEYMDERIQGFNAAFASASFQPGAGIRGGGTRTAKDPPANFREST